MLKPGVTLIQANAQMKLAYGQFHRLYPQSDPKGGFAVEPLRDSIVNESRKSLLVLLGAVGLVLLIACANVANLLLVRAEGRHQELAVRAALGASRWRIVSDFLLESVVICALGSALGLGLAFGALRLLIAIAPQGLPRLQDIGIDWTVLAFTVAVSLFCSLLFGSIPALRYASARMGTGLREGGRSVSQGRERHRTRNALVVIQVSLAFVLLICSGLMIRTFRALTHVDAGFDSAAPIQTVRLAIPDAEVPKAENVMRMEEAIVRKIEAVPGVTHVALANSVPMDGSQWSDPVFAQDKSYADGALPPLRRFKFVSPGFLGTVGIPLVTGRDFTWAEIYQKVPVALVSENFAREYWGGPAQALGKHVRVSTKDDWREVVGVVGDMHDDGMNKDAPTIAYWPILMSHFENGDDKDDNVRRWVVFAIRSSRAGSESLMKDVRQAVWSVDANLPLSDVHTQEYYYSKSMARTSFTLVMLGVAASIALLLGVVGLYGVIAYSASQRRREIGIRIALGAQRNDITGMFVRQGLLLAGSGVVCGLLVALGATRLMRSLLFHVSPMDPLTYGCAVFALCGAAALASYLPSRRTASVNPVEALRAE
jgi:predicted permease